MKNIDKVENKRFAEQFFQNLQFITKMFPFFMHMFSFMDIISVIFTVTYT